MLCSYCSTHNPDTHRFCGECGQPLVRQQVTAPAEFSRQEPYQTTISGPSFLGLTDTSETDSADYLFEDEQPRKSHAGWVIFSFIAVVLLAVVGWLEWNAIKTGQIELPWLKSATTASSPQPTEPSENAAGTPATSESAMNPGEQKPQSDNAEADKNSGGDTADANKSAAMVDSEADGQKAEGHKSDANDQKADAEATNAAQSRIASDAAKRREQADASDDSTSTADDDGATKAERPAATPKGVKAITQKAPDPRQDRMLVTGEKYLYGRGVRQDCNQALVYFKAAAERDNAPAMSHLGAMYASGHCVTANKVTAYKWFSRASEFEPGNQWISRSLNMIWRDMTPQERASVAR